MRLDLVPDQSEFVTMTPEDQAESLCSVHECKEKLRKIHRQQFIERRWNPHPPKRFKNWWNSIDRDGIHVTVAFNSQSFREQFQEAKSFGLA